METCRSELIEKREQYGIVPKSLMMDRRISVTAKVVYVALATFGQACYPSAETIAKGLGISRRTFFRAVKELEEAERLEVERRHNKTNFYHLKA